MGAHGKIIFLLGLLSFALPAVAAPKFAVTPYVQHPATDAMTIIFFTTEQCTATVTRGNMTTNTVGVWAQALTNNLVCGDTGRTTGRLYRHRVRLTGLEANRIYGYTVTLAGGATYSNSFRTAPGRDTPIRFVAYADCETKADPWDNYVKNLAQMEARKPDFIAIPGDFVARGGIQSHWDGFWRANAGDKGDIAGSIPLLTVLGNHDLYDNGVKGDKEGDYKYDLQGEPGTERYLAYFENEPNGVEYKFRDGTQIPETRDLSQLFHRVDYGPVTLIFLDTNNGDDNDPDKDTNYETRTDSTHCPPGIDRRAGGRHPDFNPGSPQYDWLTNQLADAQANSRFTFVFNHHCPYSIGSHNEGPRETGGSAQPVRVLTETMVRYGVDGWICGHDEILEHSITDGYEILPDGSRRKHTLSIYDLGCSGDAFRQSNSCQNPLEYFKVTTSNYGFLEVDVNTNRNGRWTCSLTPVDVSGGSYRAHADQIILEENPERLESANDLVYAEYAKTKAIAGVSSTKPANWLEFSREEPAPEEPDDPPEPETDQDETIVLAPGASTNLTTVTTAGSWNARVPSTSAVTVRVSRNADGTAKITLTGGTISDDNLTADEVFAQHRATVEIRSGSATSGQGTLVKTITVNLGEAIRLKKGESVDRPLSYKDDRRWAVACEQDGACVDVALDKTSEADPQNGYGYCLRTTKAAPSATLTMTGKAVGTETVVFGRQYVTSSKVTKPTAMAIYYVTVYDEEEPPVDPPEPPPPAEETIEVVEDQSVTRTLSFDEDCIWLFGGEKAFANARAALNIGYTFITGSVDYHYMSTRKASEVTVTLTGVLAGEERIFVARRAANNVFVPMAIYTVKVTPREKTPYEKLCAAFAAGGEYALAEDVECPREGLLELGEGQSLALDLNGCSILCHADGTIRNAGDLTIRDSTASDPFAAHVAFGEDELGKGLALIRNRPGATLTVDGAWIEAGFIDATGDYEFGGGNTAVFAQGGLVSVTGGGHLGGLIGIDVTGPADVFIDCGAEVIADTWRSGGLQLGTCVRFDAGDSSLTVGDALLESEGRIVQTLDGSELEATFSDATLRSSRASAPFEVADGATVSFADSSYEDPTAATRISQVTALANAGAALSVGAGCTLTVRGESVIGFLADGVTAEAVGAHTWRTVMAGGEGEWAQISRKLGAETEFANEPQIAFSAADVVPADGGLAMRVTVAVRDGGAVKAVDPDKVKAYFEATDDLADWTGGAIGLQVTSATRNADGTMEFAVRLADAPPKAFVRLRVR